MLLEVTLTDTVRANLPSRDARHRAACKASPWNGWAFAPIVYKMDRNNPRRRERQQECLYKSARSSAGLLNICRALTSGHKGMIGLSSLRLLCYREETGSIS